MLKHFICYSIRPEDDALSQLQGHSIAYRIAMGLHQGRKVLTLQSLPPRLDTPRSLIEYLNKLVFPCMPGDGRTPPARYRNDCVVTYPGQPFRKSG